MFPFDNNTPRARGKEAEELACGFLQQQGLTPVTSNYQTKLGEIDLIMQDSDAVVFVEVRYRRNTDFGSGGETVSYRKQRRLRNTANLYLQNHHPRRLPPCRFDVISISLHDNKPAIDWVKNAF